MPEAAHSKEPETLHLAVALDGAGWHPTAWDNTAWSNASQGNSAGETPEARRPDLFTAGYWGNLAREAEAGLLDFLTIEDSLGPRPWGGVRPRTGKTRSGDMTGRLDAVLLAARIAPLTSGIGIIPAVVTTHTEPFHVSTALATLDYASEGRAGWQPRVSASPAEAAHFGRRDFPEVAWDTPEAARLSADLFDEAADHVEVVRRLWDSWEDDAVIRDVATGRFIDREKLHYIDFEGRWFSVRGPSITPRPPQGQPVTAALAHAGAAYRFAARAADVVFVTPRDPAHAAEIIQEINSFSSERIGLALAVYADLTVFIDEEPGAAAARRAALDEAAGREYLSDSAIVAGTPAELADLLLAWREAGLDGFRLRPGVLPHDLERITRGLVPELQRRGVFRTSYAESTHAGATLRERLGLDPHPVNRYAEAS
jgi:alkanesulfonate monooxygenase SsuD/methylene tetrahydromethanopterin reductase-like flavin-dependent oxidoreductase (luciferase family)